MAAECKKEEKEIMAAGCKKEEKEIIKNKGSCAGGANTNIFGKQFECKTSMEKNLRDGGFNPKWIGKGKFDFYLVKQIDNITTILWFTQTGLKTYLLQNYHIALYRNPDEAFVIKMNDKCTIKILEKKEQHTEGSVETKLWAGPALKREYEIVLGPAFRVEYAYCVNVFLSKKFASGARKYEVLKQILTENNILVFHANDNDYFAQLECWIRSS